MPLFVRGVTGKSPCSGFGERLKQPSFGIVGCFYCKCLARGSRCTLILFIALGSNICEGYLRSTLLSGAWEERANLKVMHLYIEGLNVLKGAVGMKEYYHLSNESYCFKDWKPAWAALIDEFLGYYLRDWQPCKPIIVIMGYTVAVKAIKKGWVAVTSTHFNITARRSMKNMCSSSISVFNCHGRMSLNR